MAKGGRDSSARAPTRKVDAGKGSAALMGPRYPLRGRAGYKEFLAERWSIIRAPVWGRTGAIGPATQGPMDWAQGSPDLGPKLYGGYCLPSGAPAENGTSRLRGALWEKEGLEGRSTREPADGLVEFLVFATPREAEAGSVQARDGKVKNELIAGPGQPAFQRARLSFWHSASRTFELKKLLRV